MSLQRVTRNAAKITSSISQASPVRQASKSTKKQKEKDSKGESEQVINGVGTDAVPSTPPAKKAKKSHPKSVPETPRSPPDDQMAALYSTGDIDDAIPSSLLTERPAEPHITNAPLKTPGGSRVVTYSDKVLQSSPSKSGIPRPTTTTGHLLEEACAHLIKIEPRLKPAIDQHHCRIFSPEGLAEEIDPFRSLSSGIMAQQVSGAAATSIKKKFISLFHDAPAEGEEEKAWKFPTPAQVAEKDVTFLRQAGLSGRKAEYIKGLAEKFASGELSAKMLIEADYEEVLEKLTAVRGLGQWSVEMFACFALKRMDVFSTGDLGVQRGMAAFLGKDVKKLKAKGGGKWKYLSEKEMLEHSARFAPYRSLFMWYMWRIEDVNVAAIQDN